MDKKLVGLIIIFVLVFSVFVGTIILENPIRTRARNSREAAQCYLFAPVYKIFKANGQDRANITVSVSDRDLFVVPNKMVVISASSGQLNKNQATTNESGIASFSLTSSLPTTATLKAQIGPIQCNKGNGVSVVFK